MFYLLLLGAYLIGSIPSALIVGKLFNNGIDIRELGSGNLGTTNASRFLRFENTAIIALFDVFIKGTLVTLLFGYLANKYNVTVLDVNVPGLIFGYASLMGHNYPIFAGFKGGKGFATTIGLIFAHGFGYGLAALALFILVIIVTKYVAVASFTTCLTFSILGAIYLDYPLYVRITMIVFVGVLLYQHRSNVKRLLKGEESKVNVRLPFKK